LFGILLIGFTLRVYGINWDQGYHLHPDERMLIMVAEKIHFFSNLNPDFFNYGSLPIYILSGSAQLFDTLFSTHFDTYDGMLYLGRFISTAFDLLTIIVLFKLSELLFKNKTISLLVSFIYAIAVFPIQNSHFFIVDTPLTFFITLLIYVLLLFVKKPSLKLILIIAIVGAAAVTTKFTAVIFLPLMFLYTSIGIFACKKIMRFDTLFIYFVTLIGVLFVTSYIFMPYAYLEHEQYIKEILYQVRMNNDAFVFPYTLQFVGTTPYLYYLTNIFYWGLGPLFSIAALGGLISYFINVGIHFSQRHRSITNWVRYFRAHIKDKDGLFILACFYYLFFFLVLGKSSVKFMRYMLPLYPFLTLLASFTLYKILNTKYKILRISGILLLLLSCIWTLMFMSIYSHEQTRITASKWIFQHIPAGSTLAVEHWDDRLPLMIEPVQEYNYEELTLYDPDTPEKWRKINGQLSKTDYIIIASNRLYTPLQELTDCTKLPSYRCYPETAQYYKELFSEKRGFMKVAEFTSYPSLLGFFISDDSASELFTVLDHPKIMIFKNTSSKINVTSQAHQ
jgi:hypothetical protein